MGANGLQPRLLVLFDDSAVHGRASLTKEVEAAPLA
jgi:hypothetical protein